MAISQPNKLHPNAKDLTGKKFGRLTVVEFAGRKLPGRLKWKCICDCGVVLIVVGTDLSHGNTTSCGCKKREIQSTYGQRAKSEWATVHGMDGTPIYRRWCGMIERCCNSKSKHFTRYGRRGITVCDRWRYSFENFYDDMGSPPSSDLSIDRINNNGNYEPGNCRWATKTEQALNRRNNNYLEFNGKRLSISEWSDAIGINKQTICERIKCGMTIDMILSPEKFTKSTRNRRFTTVLEWNGEDLTVDEWSRRINVPWRTIFDRIKAGWTVEKIMTTGDRSRKKK